jgi:hypothetical protein
MLAMLDKKVIYCRSPVWNYIGQLYFSGRIRSAVFTSVVDPEYYPNPGSWILDPDFFQSRILVPDQGGKKITQEPGSGSAALILTVPAV